MNKKYKIVNVYTGYNENDILGVNVVEGNSLKDVCIKLLEEKKLKLKEDESYFEEFVNGWGVKGGVGYVGDGEEGIDVVIDENSEWWDFVDKEYDDKWDDEVCEKWEKWMDVSEYDVEGKI